MKKSLVKSFMLSFAIYTLIIVLVCSFFQQLVNQRIDASLFTMEDLLAYEEAIVNEDYAEIPTKNSKYSAFIIFDQNGQTMYASNRTISEEIRYADADLIGDYNSGQFFNVFQESTPQGPLYHIQLIVYGSEDNDTVPQLMDSCSINADYQIISGNLFSNRGTLSQREFELLSSISKSKNSLEKYTYKNAAGDNRTLIFYATRVSDKELSNIITSANSIWFIGIPCVILAILLLTILFSRGTKRLLSPLDRVITAYKTGHSAGITPSDIPIEFQETLLNFEALLDQLESTRREKDLLYEEKQRLIADISHDLKTPLTVIQGYAKALSEKRVPREKVDRYTNAILNKAALATTMVNDLFLFTQMEHPDYPVHLEETDFCEFIKEFFATKYMEITEKGFLVSVDIPDESHRLFFDKKLILRLLENLLSNTLKYNPKGTTLGVAIHPYDKEILLVVADDGIGIPEEIGKTLFHPFVTGNQARTAGNGTGLGLSITHRIMAVHGGSMILSPQTQPPWKTEFQMCFPIIKDANQPKIK